MLAVDELKSKVVSRAVKNLQRGYSVDEAGRSMFRPEVKLDLQRSRLMTESFKQTDGEAMVVRRAKALSNVLNKMKIVIRDYERIVGYQTEDPDGLSHPIDMNWRSVKRLVNSDAGRTLLDDAGRKEFDELCSYWDGKAMSDRHQNIFSGDLNKYWRYEGTFLWAGHLSELGIPDYEKLFKSGLKGRINLAEERLAEIDKTIPVDYVDQKEFLESAIMILKAVVNFSKRYAAKARELAASETGSDRKRELERIAETCEWVPENAPRSFLEAVQFFYFIHLIRYLEYSTLGIGARIDHLLGPFYEKDLAAGQISKEEAVEIFQLLWVKLNELGLVYSPLVSSVYGGVASLQAVTIGGIDKGGRDVTNDLTYAVLEVAKTMRMIEPSIVLRVHKGTPDKLFSEAVDVIKTGIGYPSLFNDGALIPLLEKWGVPIEDANDYAVTGCVYLEIPGKNMMRRSAGYFVLPKCLWWALHQGVNPDTGDQFGARTPAPAAIQTWEDLLDAYLAQVKFFTTKMSQLEMTCLRLYTKYCPRPFYSSVVDGCIETGKESRKWRYPSMVHHFIQTIGGTNVADAITAVKKVVFEDKRVSLPELVRIMDANWDGRDDIRQACINAPKYGNDDEYADAIARIVQHRTEETMESVKDAFGFSNRADGSAVSATYGLAVDTPATPEGRVNGEPFADSTLAPIPGADKKGPTAVLNSCAKIDTLQTFNHLLNQKFLQKFLEEDMKPKFVSYLKTWRDKKISHIQFNVVDRKTLVEAQNRPDDYQDLIVRVAGFSAYFVDLSKGLQDHIIARTEQSLA